jgi:hypothetical protein
MFDRFQKFFMRKCKVGTFVAVSKYQILQNSNIYQGINIFLKGFSRAQLGYGTIRG